MKNVEYYEGVKIGGANVARGKKMRNAERQPVGKFQDVKFKKSLGQNFLSDKNLLNKIAEFAEVSNQDNVLEIGAGAGTLTDVLSTQAKSVLSFEIDKSLSERLNEIERRHSNLKIVFEDFMNVNLDGVFPRERFKVVANIPYYITTPIIFKLLEVCNRIDTMIFMVQKEVAERFASKENTKEYGVTSVILQSIADVNLKKIVKKECFTPMPKVDSALVEIKIVNEKYEINDRSEFCNFIHKAFSMRRKTLMNNLIKNYQIDKKKIIKALNEVELCENIRPEQISVEKYVKIFNLLF